MTKNLLKIIAFTFLLLANGGREKISNNFSTGTPKSISKSTECYNYKLPFSKNLNMQINFGDYNNDWKIDASVLIYYTGTEKMILHYFYNKGQGEIKHEIYKP